MGKLSITTDEGSWMRAGNSSQARANPTDYIRLISRKLGNREI